MRRLGTFLHHCSKLRQVLVSVRSRQKRQLRPGGISAQSGKVSTAKVENKKSWWWLGGEAKRLSSRIASTPTFDTRTRRLRSLSILRSPAFPLSATPVSANSLILDGSRKASSCSQLWHSIRHPHLFGSTRQLTHPTTLRTTSKTWDIWLWCS